MALGEKKNGGRHWGGWYTERQGRRQTDRQADWQTQKKKHINILNYHILFSSPNTWQWRKGDIYPSATCLYLVNYSANTEAAAVQYDKSVQKKNYFMRWEPSSLTGRTSFMFKLNCWLWNVIVKSQVSVGESDSYSQLLKHNYFGGLTCFFNLPVISIQHTACIYSTCRWKKKASCALQHYPREIMLLR